MDTNLDELRRRVSLVDTAFAVGVDLEPDGNEWIGLCPFHGEKTPSFTLFLGKDHVWRFQCFGCGEHGDVIDFIERIKGCSTAQAIDRLKGELGASDNLPLVASSGRDVYEGIVAMPPEGAIIPGRRIAIYNPKRQKTTTLTPSMVFPYRRLDGSLIGYVLRHDLVGGGKETPSVHWVRLPDGTVCWARFPFEKPRPLYRQEHIGDARQVIVVEGEKCADAQAELRGKPAVSWIGGTYGVKYADWSPLSGRDALIVPDCDGPGLSTAIEIAECLTGVADRVRIVDVTKEARL